VSARARGDAAPAGPSARAGLAGVDKASVDTWLHPHLFHMDFSTGAPPDYFDANGQNWGFPTYNWEAMAADGYAWWRARLSKLAECAPAGACPDALARPRVVALAHRGLCDGVQAIGRHQGSAASGSTELPRGPPCWKASCM